MTDKRKGPASGVDARAHSGSSADNVAYTDDADNITAASHYLKIGLRLVRLEPNKKIPISEKGWQNSSPAAQDFLPEENVGVQLGAKSGHLVDIDLDIPQSRRLAGMGCFFGHLPYFRRESLPVEQPGHRLVVCEDAPDKVEQFNFTTKTELKEVEELKLEKGVILELRAGRSYTVFPPSVIDGDQLVWNTPHSTLPKMEWDELRKRAGLLAFCALALASYPSRGARDDFCLHLAGALLNVGVPVELADEIVLEVARQAGDEEAAKRKDKAVRTAERQAAGEPVTGLPAFLELIGLRKCEKRIRAWLDMPHGNSGDDIPESAILVGRPDLHAFVDEVQNASLAKLPDQIFVNGGRLARLRVLEKEDRPVEGVTRSPGITEIASLDSAWFRIALSRGGVAFYKKTLKGSCFFVEPPRDVGLLLSIADETSFPRLRGISMTPTLRRSEPGYDEDSRLFLAFPAETFPPSPEPTRENAEAAMRRLKEPLREFPFINEASRSVVLSMFLSAVVRGELRTCPMHCVSAPSAGTGKTKLNEMAGIIATGAPPSHATHSRSPEEMEKRLVSILRCGDPVINLDNVEHPLEGDFLCAMLTADTVQGRILGESEMVRLDTRALMLATGNNLRLRGDMVRRAVVSRIDARCERPDKREFDFDPVEEVRRNREQLVVDALTILRAYMAADLPLPDGYVTLGSFEAYDLIRGALLWLGEADPVETQAVAYEEDEEREKRSVILNELWQQFGRRPFYAREIGGHGEEGEARREIFAEYSRSGKWSGREAGYILRSLKDCPCGDLILRGEPDRNHTMQWRMEGDGGQRSEPPF